MKYYSLKELQTNNFDDKEILDVFNNGNFVKSSIISMFRFINLDYSDKEILNIVSKQNWMNSICWTWKDHDNFIIEMAKVYKNIYQYNTITSFTMAQEFVCKFGFIVKDTKANENRHYKRLLKYKF